MSIRSLLLSFSLTAAVATGIASAAPQDSHCKLSDGTFDATKTKAQCDSAKGTWVKDATFTGTLKSGLVGIETTGIELTVGATTYELDVHGDKDLARAADSLNGKSVTVTGYTFKKRGVEVAEHNLVVATTLKLAAAKK